MASFLQKLFGIKQPKPVVSGTPPTPTLEEDFSEIEKFRKRRQGRAATLLTGDLVPEETGKKTLLG